MVWVRRVFDEIGLSRYHFRSQGFDIVHVGVELSLSVSAVALLAVAFGSAARLVHEAGFNSRT